MKDYRTWWRKGFDTAAILYQPVSGYHINSNGWPVIYGVDRENADCFLEQLFAIREGLA